MSDYVDGRDSGGTGLSAGSPVHERAVAAQEELQGKTIATESLSNWLIGTRIPEIH
jgi:hypothetical protein